MGLRLLFLAVCGLAYPCLGADGTPKLSDLAWLEGRWVGEKDGGAIEEHWSRGADNSMIGMFRSLNDEQAQRYEFKVIDQTEKGLFLYLRHYGQKLVAQEEKDKPMVFFATTEPPPAQAVVFERIDRPETRTKLFYRIERGKLVVALDQLIEKKRNIEVFEFKRADDAKTR